MVKGMVSRRILPFTAMLMAFLIALSNGAVIDTSARTDEEIKNSISSIEDRLDAIEAQKKALSNSMKEVENERTAAIKKKKVYEEQINILEDEISTLEEYIGELELEHAAKVEEEAELENQIEYKFEQFKKRARSSYEEGEDTFLSILLSCTSVSDILTRFEVEKSLIEYDNKVIDDLRDHKDEVEQLKNEIADNLYKQEASQEQLKTQKTELSAQNKKNNEIISYLSSNSESLKEEYAAVAKEEEALEKEVKNLLAQLSNSKYVGGEFLWPLEGYYKISSEFGYRIHPILGYNKLHSGTDIPAPKGTKIMAANSGNVVTSAYSSSWGNYIIIDHGGGYATLYAHMSKRISVVGDTVRRGDKIGEVGTTGWSTGNHLHFEIRIKGEPVDPMTYFK